MFIMKEKKTLPVYISQASFGKEIGAFAIDALFALIVGTAIRYTLGSYVIAPAAGYNEAKEAYYSLAEASGLYSRNDGNLELISYEDKGEALYNHYGELNNVVWNYYFSACGQGNGANDNGFVVNGFETELEIGAPGYAEELGKHILYAVYDIAIDEDRSPEVPNPYFTVAQKDGSENPLDYTSAPVLNADTQAKLTDPATDEDSRLALLKSIYEVFMGDGQTTGGLYAKACNSFVVQPSALAYESIGSKAMYLASVPGTLAAPLIFFFLVPCFTKRGKTLGKLFLKMSVIHADGYKAGKVNVMLHAFLAMLPLALLLLPFSQMLTFLMVALVYLVEYIVMLMNRQHQCIHDMLSQTIVIDDRTTEAIFDDAEEEAEYARTNNDDLARMIRGEDETHAAPATSSAPVILDSRTIGAAREEAKNIENFDEFETRKNTEETPVVPSDEKETPEESASEEKVLDEERWKEDPEMADMMAMDGISPEDAEAEDVPNETETPKAEEEPGDANSDDFLDAK